MVTRRQTSSVSSLDFWSRSGISWNGSFCSLNSVKLARILPAMFGNNRAHLGTHTKIAKYIAKHPWKWLSSTSISWFLILLRSPTAWWQVQAWGPCKTWSFLVLKEAALCRLFPVEREKGVCDEVEFFPSLFSQRMVERSRDCRTASEAACTLDCGSHLTFHKKRNRKRNCLENKNQQRQTPMRFTLWGSTHLYSLFRGVPTPFPPHNSLSVWIK